MSRSPQAGYLLLVVATLRRSRRGSNLGNRAFGNRAPSSALREIASLRLC